MCILLLRFQISYYSTCRIFRLLSSNILPEIPNRLRLTAYVTIPYIDTNRLLLNLAGADFTDLFMFLCMLFFFLFCHRERVLESIRSIFQIFLLLKITKQNSLRQSKFSRPLMTIDVNTYQRNWKSF